MEINFENMTIGELRRLTAEFKRLTPNFKTAEEVLKERKNEKA